jgi:transcriptional regulator of aromatic amino acid metabolism
LQSRLLRVLQDGEFERLGSPPYTQGRCAGHCCDQSGLGRRSS